MMNYKEGLLDKSNSKISLKIWIAWIMSYMKDNGLYTLVCVYNTYLKTEVYFLNEWGADKDSVVSNWVQTLTTTGVRNGR